MLEPVARKFFGRLEGCGTHILQVDILHIAVNFDFDADCNLVADLEVGILLRNRYNHLLAVLHTVDKQILANLQRCVLESLYLVDVLVVLPVDASPSHCAVGLGDRNFAPRVFYLVLLPCLLVVAGAVLGLFGGKVDGLVAKGNCRVVGFGENAGAIEQKRINGFGGCLGGLPAVGLLLLQQPYLHIVDILIFTKFVEQLNKQRLSLDAAVVPVPSAFQIPVHTEFFAVLCVFLERCDYCLYGCGASAALHCQGKHSAHIEAPVLPIPLAKLHIGIENLLR